jgi:hypothetical protein
MPLPLNNLLAMPYSDEGRSRRSQAKADQLRKGAWLARSFTLSTINCFNEDHSPARFLRIQKTLKHLFRFNDPLAKAFGIPNSYLLRDFRSDEVVVRLEMATRL